MQIRDIMTQNPACIHPTETILRAAQEMKMHNVGALPVFEDTRLVGIITDRDIAVECVATGNQPSDCYVRDYMTADPICIGADATIDEALIRMGQEQVRRLCVVDGGELAGIISLGDLAVRMADSLALAKALAQISQPVRTPHPLSVS
jgi:CBS domain-containing protein